MDDLIAFLRARIDEDEAVMRRVLQFSREGYMQGAYESWVAERKVNNVEPPYYDYQAVRTERQATRPIELVRLELDLGGFLANHIARFGSPARVLADVAAKRAIIELHDVVVKRSGVYCPQCGGRDWDLDEVNPMSAGGCNTLRLLALPYADHPSYRSEWKP